MLSLFARRVALAVRTARPATRVVARRTLFATPQLNLPAANTAEKTPEKKATKPKDAKRGRGRPPKKEKKEKEKQRTRVPQSLKPPKRAPGPYFLFYTSFIKSQAKGNTIQEFQELSKRASEIWRGYSMAEKQPYYDENEARKIQAKKERDEFFQNTSLSDLKQLNAIRKAQGKTKYHSTKKPSLPITPFISFSNEFRNSPDGQAIINGTSLEKRYAVRAVMAAAERWRSMSAEEKAPYFERFKKEKEGLKAEHTES